MASQTRTTLSAFTAEKIETIFKAVLSFTAVIYAIGFIVVNGNYTSYGITDFDLVQTRYIAAGLNYLLMHASLAALVAIVLFCLQKPSRKFWMAAFFSLWVLLSSAIYLRSGSYIEAVIVGVNASIITLIGYGFWLTFKSGLENWSLNIEFDVKSKPLLVVYLGVILILLVVMSAVTWGLSFWPRMSTTLGGGRPAEAIFILDIENWPEEGSIYIPTQTDAVTKQLPVLFENSDGYIVLVKGIAKKQVAVSISKSMVLSAIYAPSIQFGQKEVLKTCPTLTTTSIQQAADTLTPPVTPRAASPTITLTVSPRISSTPSTPVEKAIP